ncbi:hypothetical protein U27_01371 [Candidatus Vecturithrix granuli]|uniref:DUF4276 family protein n=1 Tax=Vecturithrix granuli TaxID=1499967 RepID=A0A081CA65_VECG1|nr:hypothetical protein U27_01371 [Candidatus Vecturithrix granuli]
MIPQIMIGFATEGTTDVRFLESIIQRTFEEVAFECESSIEVLPVQSLKKITGKDFVDLVLEYAKTSFEHGIMVLCVHADADEANDSNALTYKIIPAFEAVQQMRAEVCKNLAAIVPVQMTEAWMLADIDLLRREIGTSKSAHELGIAKKPESYARPKEAIEEAIRLGRADIPARRRHQLNIAELYQPLGQKIQLEKLEQLAAYQKFKEAVRQAYRKLNYLH